jgi:pilus assembly protein CpaF
MKELSESKRIVLVAGAKGGIGRSVVACNLAVAFARKRPTALLDLDWLSGGSQASYLDLAPSRHWGECLEDTAMLPSCMIEHASKVKLLAAPPPGFQPPRPRQLAKLIGEIARHFSYLVIDTSYPFIDERMEVLIDFASPVLLVVTPDITTLQSTKVFLESARRLNYPQDRFQLVFNRAGITDDLDATDLSGSLERPIIGQIPHHPSVVTSLNRGLPIVHHHPNSSIASAFLNLAARTAANPSSPVGQVLSQIMSKPEEKKNEPKIEEKKESENPARPVEEKNEGVTALAVRQGVALSAEQAVARKAIHGELIEELKRLDIHIPKFTTPEEHQNLRNQIAEVVAHILDEMEGINLRNRAERTKLVADITDEAIGYGPLERFLADPLVTEIMVNGPDSIYVEQKGKISLTNQGFTNEAQLRVVIDRIVAPLGRRVDESSPMCDARLPDGSRVNIIIPPLAIRGSTITIRKFSKTRLTTENLIAYGSLNQLMARFLRACVLARLNIFISGGTGSGKTTLLNVLSSFIPSDERIVTIEDSAELKLNQDHVITLESRPANLEGTGEVAIRDLVRNSLRMRPDRIIVGEVRGGEALDMLQAMNTGHDGSLATGHANTPRDALARLETMVLMAGMDLPVRAIREQIASAINIIVQQTRLKDGTRKIVKISEVTGMEGEIITMHDVFTFDQQSVDAGGKVVGGFRLTGIRANAIEQFEKMGIPWEE